MQDSAGIRLYLGQMTVILQDILPEAHYGAPGLPGIAPCQPDDWLRVDEAYAAQMAYRRALIAERPADVLWHDPQAQAAEVEVLRAALKLLPGLGFEVADESVVCPDGQVVKLDFASPLKALGKLVQEDICILQRQENEHVLTAAVVCFPANWRLAEKAGRPLVGIHDTVAEYDADVARRVQRLFDGVRVGRPLWRFNRLSYAEADLHQPWRHNTTAPPRFERSERQCILRLPQSDAVVFTIHTWVVAQETPQQHER